MAKYRFGYVSNSSSSSFLLFGICLDDTDELKKLVSGEVKLNDDGEDEDDEDDWEVCEKVEEVLAKEGLEHHDVYDTHYIGRCFSTIKDEETGLQFKSSVKETLERLLGRKVACSTHAEAWRDG